MAKPRMTTDQFIERARERYGDRFAYDRCAYKNMKTHVCITCPEHGDVMVHPEFFLVKARHGCPDCSSLHPKKPPQYTTDSLIAKYKAIWGEEFDYSEVVYEAWEKKVKIRHRECGRVFWQVPGSHFKYGCQKCSAIRRGKATSQRHGNNFVARAQEIHGDRYCYDAVDFVDMRSKVAIRCPEHNLTFYTAPFNHLHPERPTGCPECGREKQASLSSMGAAEFARQAQEMHGSQHEYDLVEYVNNREKVPIRCVNHGVFMQTPGAHLSGSGCPLCVGSRMEKRIALLLRRWGVSYVAQHSFSDCRRAHPLPFDFAILSTDGNLCGVIEYQGDQHFRPVDYFGGQKGFLYRQQNDKIKHDYCHERGIPLLIATSDDDRNIGAVLHDYCRSLGVL